MVVDVSSIILKIIPKVISGLCVKESLNPPVMPAVGATGREAIKIFNTLFNNYLFT